MFYLVAMLSAPPDTLLLFSAASLVCCSCPSVPLVFPRLFVLSTAALFFSSFRLSISFWSLSLVSSICCCRSFSSCVSWLILGLFGLFHFVVIHFVKIIAGSRH